MRPIPDRLRKPALAIVAHPDDETIWAGGLIMLHPQWNWTIMSLCRGDDPDRHPRFERVCERLNAVPIIENLDDSPQLREIDPMEIGERITNSVGSQEWALCITHGPNGEYGHQRHVDVHNEVVRLCSSGRLGCNELWSFAYSVHARNGTCIAADRADLLLQLTPAQLAEKRDIVESLYGFLPNSFESNVCAASEFFRSHTIPQ